jgi:hypothetical protein
MKRFIMFRRAGVYYSEDTTTRKQHSLRTKDEAEALTLLHSKNEAHRQPVLNLHIARTYLTATDPEIAKRTWQAPMDEMTRTKTGPTLIRFGKELEGVLRTLPQVGPLFPKLKPMREAHRATEFARACRRLMIKGVTLHSYRYAWAERAKICGYPERFAQEALGHNSKAVHRAYARKAQVVIPTLEDYERKMATASADVIVPMPAAVA